MFQAHPDRQLTKITLLVVSTLTVMAGATIAPALPAMHAAFSDIPNVDLLVRLVLTIPGLFIVLGAPVAGFIVDRSGRKRILVVSTALYAITGSAGYFFDSMTAILISRALLGIAVAGIMISVTTLIADYYQDEARARFLGRQAAFMNFGGVVFTAAGGVLADITWQTPFLIYLVAFVILPFAVIALLEPRRDPIVREEFDAEGHSSASFPIGQLLPIYVTALVLLTTFVMMIIQLPFLLQTVAGASATQSGLAISGAILFSIPPSLLFGRISKRLDMFSIVTIGFILFGIGYPIIGLGGGFASIFVGSAIAGVGLGLLMPTLNVWLVARAPVAFRGRAFGLLTTAVFFGQFISPFVTEPISAQVGMGNSFIVVGAAMFAVAAAFFIGGRVNSNEAARVQTEQA